MTVQKFNLRGVSTQVQRGGLLRLLLCLAFAMILQAPSASAQSPSSVALLNFTPRRVAPDFVQTFSRNLRESFFLDGRFDLYDEVQMYQTLTGAEGADNLKAARTLLAEAKGDFRAEQYEDALAKLEEVRSLHRKIFSELSRADELADVMLYQGLCQYHLENLSAAKVAFLQMFLLHPGIEIQRIPALTPDILKLVEAAHRLERITPLRGLTTAFATDIANKLQVAFLIYGVVEGSEKGVGSSKSVTIQVMARDQGQAVETMVFDVMDDGRGIPPAGAPIYSRIIGIAERFLSAAR